jgi:hypothetical protein
MESSKFTTMNNNHKNITRDATTIRMGTLGAKMSSTEKKPKL